MKQFRNHSGDNGLKAFAFKVVLAAISRTEALRLATGFWYALTGSPNKRAQHISFSNSCFYQTKLISNKFNRITNGNLIKNSSGSLEIKVLILLRIGRERVHKKKPYLIGIIRLLLVFGEFSSSR